jgi:hypothetical protein
MIEAYEYGKMTVNGEVFQGQGDLKIYDGNVHAGWWLETRHDMQPQDLQDIPEDCEFLVIGSGEDGNCQVATATLQMLNDRGLPYKVEMTGNAKDTFNQLEQEGKKVMGAFHLNC